MLNTQQKNTVKKYAIYSIGFLLIVSVWALILAIFGRRFVWSIDGKQMSYTGAVYFGQWIKHIFSFGTVPLVDFTLGEGLDVIATTAYYGFGDPLNLIFAIIPETWYETGYTLICFLRLYLSGLAFGIFADYIQKKTGIEQNPIGIACGSLVYAFSGFAVFFSLVGPNLFSCQLYFPLILLTIEQTFDGKRYGYVWTALTTFLAYCSNFFAGIQVSMMLVVYAVIRGIITKSIKKYARVSLSHLLGITMSAVILVPAAFGILQTGRLSGNVGYSRSLVVYPFSYYLDLIRNLFLPLTNTGTYFKYVYTPLLNFAVITLPCFLLAFRKENKDKTLIRILKASALCSAVFLLIPIFAKLTNGGSYPMHRWLFALDLTAALSVSVFIPELKKVSGKEKIIVSAWIVIGCVLSVFMTNTGPSVGVPVYGAIMLLILLPGQMKEKRVCVLTIVGIMLSTAVTFGLDGFVDAFDENTYPISNDSVLYINDEEANTDFYRVAEYESSANCNNHGPLYNKKLVTSFWNITPKPLTDWYTGVAMPQQRTNFALHGYNERADLYSFSGVKYYASLNGSAPFGFEHLYDAENVGIYRNSYYRGIISLYPKTLSRAIYDVLEPMEKVSSLNKFAITEDGEKTEIEKDYIELRYNTKITETSEENAYMKTGLKGKNKLYTYTFEVPKDCEIYLNFKNGGEAVLVFEVQNGDRYKYKWLNERDKESHLYFEKPSPLICLGSDLNGETTVRVVYTEKHELSDLHIYAVPTERIASRLKSISENLDLLSSEYSVVGQEGRQNYYSCEINAKSSGVIQIAIPNSPWWKIKVDGKEIQWKPVGIKYIGFETEQGQHRIEMEYDNLAVKVGAIISVAAAVGFVCMIACISIKQKKT